MRINKILVAATALFNMAACGPRDQPTNANENAAPPLSEPTLDGSAPVTITPGADPYPVTTGGAEGSQEPPIVTPDHSAPPGPMP